MAAAVLAQRPVEHLENGGTYFLPQRSVPVGTGAVENSRHGPIFYRYSKLLKNCLRLLEPAPMATVAMENGMERQGSELFSRLSRPEGLRQRV